MNYANLKIEKGIAIPNRKTGSVKAYQVINKMSVGDSVLFTGNTILSANKMASRFQNNSSYAAMKSGKRIKLTRRVVGIKSVRVWRIV